MTKSYKKIAIAFLLGLITLIMISTKAPLTDVHWDAPIYMYGASGFGTATLQHYSTNAAEITRAIPYTKPFSGAYWTFSRGGHIALLGSVVAVFGATSEAIQISTGLYVILMVLAVVMSTFVATTTIDLLGASLRRSIVGYAAAFSASLYMASDIFSYLAGNLVTEVPSLFLLSTSAWLLLKALQKHSLLLAATSGSCAFLLYVVRMESLWNYVAFVVCLAPILFWHARARFWWQGFAVSALSALVFYALYAWAFYPLANPATFLEFALSQKKISVPRHSAAIFIFIAGGALWIGCLLSLRSLRVCAATQLSLGWLFLTLLPWLPAMVLDLPVQTRMLAFVMPPLLLASTMGWTVLFEKWEQHRVATAAFILLAVLMILVSNPLTYPLIQSLPVVWHIQYARPFLAAPERNTYPVNTLRELSNTLYATTMPTIVWWNPKQIREEDLWVVQYFAPHYPENIDTKRLQNMSTQNVCDDKVPLPFFEPVVFCTRLNTDAVQRAKNGSLRILKLHAKLSRHELSDLHVEDIPFNDLSITK